MVTFLGRETFWYRKIIRQTRVKRLMYNVSTSGKVDFAELNDSLCILNIIAFFFLSSLAT